MIRPSTQRSGRLGMRVTRRGPRNEVVSLAVLAIACLAPACGGRAAGETPTEPDRMDAGGEDAPTFRTDGGGDAKDEGSGGSSGHGFPEAAATGGVAGVGLAPAMDPECPDASSNAPMLECDLFDAPRGGCPDGQVCYPGAVDGNGPCDRSTFVTYCDEPGPGAQEATCSDNAQCSAGFICTGTPFRCGYLCYPGRPCPDGLVCEGVVGFEGAGTCR